MPPDFSIKPATINAIRAFASSKLDSLKNAYNDFLGITNFIGEENVFDILNCVEELETDYEYGYSQQKGIGQKPVLVYNGEGLRQCSLNVKLHHKFCRPDYILEQLKEKAAAHVPFSYYQNEKYQGEFVITNIREKILNTYKGVTLNGEVTVDILECITTEDEEFEQQTKTTVEIPDDVKSVSDTVVKTPVQVAKDVAGDVFTKLTEKAVDSALRTATSYMSGVISGGSSGII